MATPQRNFPNPPLGDDNKVANEVGARARFGWVWIAVIIIAILVVWFGGFGWGTYGGWWWGGNRPQAPLAQPASVNNAQPPNAEQPAPGTSAAVVSGSGAQILASPSTNRQALVGQSFNIRNVPVQSKASNGAFWIAANNNAPMLVALNGGATNPMSADIAPGVRVNITGTVARAPSAAQAKRLWALSDNDVNRLEQQGAYVQATQVQAGQP
jgi:hypothetical protein